MLYQCCCVSVMLYQCCISCISDIKELTDEHGIKENTQEIRHKSLINLFKSIVYCEMLLCIYGDTV